MEWAVGIGVAVATFAYHLWSGRKTPKELQAQLDAQDDTLAELRESVKLALENAESANRKGSRIEAAMRITPVPVLEPRTGMHKLPVVKGRLVGDDE